MMSHIVIPEICYHHSKFDEGRLLKRGERERERKSLRERENRLWYTYYRSIWMYTSDSRNPI